MTAFNCVLTSLLSLTLALVAFSAQAQHMNSNPNTNPNSYGSQETLQNSTGMTGYRSAAEYFDQSAEEEEEERAEREKRMRAIENYGDPLAATEQSLGRQSYSRRPYGR